MPQVSSFYGITIRFFNEDFHLGRPHFHAEYAGVYRANGEAVGA